MAQRIISTGYSIPPVGGDLDHLARRLEALETMGCTGAELTAEGLDAIIACRLIPERVAALRAILGRHRLAVSLHAPIAINLMDEGHPEIMTRAAKACVRLAAEINAPMVVLHPGRCSPEDHQTRLPAMQSFELDQLDVVADLAEALGVRLAYENLSPDRRTVSGQHTSYAMDPRQLASQLARLGHGAVCACLDIGHAQQGAKWWGFDMRAACETLAPHVGHLHFSDATGLPASFAWYSDAERLLMGVGDMHAPPGWGDVDFDALAAVLAVRPGTRQVIELKPSVLGHREAQVLQQAQAFADAATAARP